MMTPATKAALLGAGLTLLLAGAAGAYPAGYVGPPGYGPPPPPYPGPGPDYGAQPYAPPYADGVTVYTRPPPYRVPDDVRELSAGVAYDDLDLATREGRDILDWRIARIADRLCDRLGEGEEAGRNSSVLPTCQASARDSARGQVRRAVEDARYAAAYAPPPPPPPAYYYPPVYAPAPVYAPPVAYVPAPCACQPAWVPPPPPGWGR